MIEVTDLAIEPEVIPVIGDVVKYEAVRRGRRQSFGRMRPSASKEQQAEIIELLLCPLAVTKTSKPWDETTPRLHEVESLHRVFGCNHPL